MSYQTSGIDQSIEAMPVNEALKEGTIVGIKKAKDQVGVMGLGLDELLNEYESELRGIKMHV